MTQEDFGGDPMSVDLKVYFDKQFESLEDKFDSLEDKVGILSEDVKALPCGEQKGMILQIQQQLANGIVAEENVRKSKTERLTMWRIGIAIIGVAIVILQVLDRIK